MLCALCLLMPTGCSIMDEGPDATALPANTAQLAFTLRVEGAAPATKTTWGDDYDKEPGQGYENRIDNLQVVLYSTDGNTAYPLQNLWQETSETTGGTYTFVGSIDLTDAGLQSGKEYKIMVFANCTDIDETTDLGNLAYSYTYQGGSNAPAIPMWGVATAQLTLQPGGRQTLAESIDLLRAVAKVEVGLGSDARQEGFSLTGVCISHSNTQGYCLPADYAAADNTGQLNRNDEGTNLDTFHPYTGDTQATDLAFTQATDGTWHIYLPEYDNSQTPATLAVTVADEKNTTEDYTLYFQTYNSGQPQAGTTYNIVRNHLYRYTITAINNGQLTVQHQVMPWDKVSSTIEFTEDVTCTLLPEGGDADPDAEAMYCILNRPRHGNTRTELRNGTAGALYEFTFNGPEGTVWTAHLSNKEDFIFSTSIENGHRLVSTGIARSEPYYIQINLQGGHDWVDPQFSEAETYNKAWRDQVEATHELISTYFYITISTDGMHEEELVINPPVTDETIPTLYSYGGSRRRFAGTDTRIWIRQVPTMYNWNIGQMAEPADPTDTGTNPWDNYYWWRVNPYWNPTANARALMENANETE